jgi:hypothetical protein
MAKHGFTVKNGIFWWHFSSGEHILMAFHFSYLKPVICDYYPWGPIYIPLSDAQKFRGVTPTETNTTSAVSLFHLLSLMYHYFTIDGCWGISCQYLHSFRLQVWITFLPYQVKAGLKGSYCPLFYNEFLLLAVQ